MKGCLPIATMLAVFLWIATGFAADGPPNLVGAWITKSEGGVMLRGAAVAKSTHWEIQQTTLRGELTITTQNGRVLSGSFTSPRHREPFIAVIGYDNKRVYFADEDGYYDATLIDADTIEMVYRHVTASDTVAAVGIWTRKK